jgi:hypothetical protein
MSSFKTTCALLLLIVSGCSVMDPVQLPPSELRQEIASGELLEPGDEARIVLDSGEQYEVEVMDISADHIIGMRTDEDREVSVPISRIDRLDVRRFSGERTGAAIVLPGMGLFFLLLVFGLSAAFVLP